MHPSNDHSRSRPSGAGDSATSDEPGAGASPTPVGPLPWTDGATPASGTPAVGDTLSRVEASLLALDPPILLLETAIPPGVVVDPGSSVSISAAHAKCGRHSMRWDHTPNARMRIDGDLNVASSTYVPGEDQSLMGVVPMFSFWVYNEIPVDDALVVTFGRDERADCGVAFNLDFRGWRTCWVRYGYDTTGQPAEDMNRITITAPARVGTLWFDLVVKNVDMRPDHATPDFQVPTIQPTIASNDNYHWLGLSDYWRRLSHPGFAGSPATTAEIDAATTVRSRLLARLRGEPELSETSLAELEAHLLALGVPQLADPDATGAALTPAAPGTFVDGFQSAVLPSALTETLIEAGAVVSLQQICDSALDVARTWDAAVTAGDADATARAEAMYLRLTVHLLDQGWAVGSAQGTIHHIGYQYLGWASSLLLAEPLLRKRQLWQPVRDAIAWYSGVGRLTHDFSELKDLCGVVDILNTVSEGMLISCLAADSWDQRVAGLRAFGAWLNLAHRHTPGILDGYKPDGFCFHHIGPYPAYGRDAMIGSIPVIVDLAGTPFELDATGAAVLRQAMRTMAEVSHTHEWPIGLCGRHPRGGEGILPLVDSYALLGRTPLAGHDGGDGVDEEMAATFRRLMPQPPTRWQQEMDDYFAARGVPVAPAPAGYWQHGYTALGVHRQDGWMASVTGHNRYRWSTEIYDGANAYGRYLSYGQIEVQSVSNAQRIVTHEANGWTQPGYDWNHIPGATTIVLPYEELKADLTGTIQELLLSESPFGGAGCLTGHAVLFGMRLAEHPTHNPTHQANISVLLVGERVIALGSDIRNDDSEHPTHTTLFQLCPETMNAPRATAKGSNWATDPAGNGYVVADGAMRVRTARQSAPHQNGVDGDGTRTMALGWIDHGPQPQDAGYDYALLVGAGASGTEAFAAAMAGDDKPYEVIQRDKVAHVVEDRLSGVIGHVVFEAHTDLVERSMVKRATRACLVVMRADGERVTLSITDPDLHLYEGPDHEQYDTHGTYEGRYSSYSRPWRSNPSPQTTISVVLRGLWTPPLTGAAPWPAARLEPEGDDTRVTVTTQHAASVELELVRQEGPGRAPRSLGL